MTLKEQDVVGVVLAGGLARRMGGGDKCLLQIGGESLLSRSLERLAPQVERMVISANGDPARFAPYKLPVVVDTIQDHAGPLAGILSGMRWAEQHASASRYIVTVASDTPFFPRDLTTRLLQVVGDEGRTIALASSGDRVHPVFGLWPVALADDLEDALLAGARKTVTWADTHNMIEVPFVVPNADGASIDPFFNINRPEDLAMAERIAKL